LVRLIGFYIVTKPECVCKPASRIDGDHDSSSARPCRSDAQRSSCGRLAYSSRAAGEH
jgi:hypothetical protein